MTELRVCIGSACHLNGARNVIASFRHMIEEHDLHDNKIRSRILHAQMQQRGRFGVG